MATDMDVSGAERAARALLDSRIEAIRTLAAARQASRDALAELHAAAESAERDDATAYRAAVRAGWTEAELRKVGLDAPAQGASGRARRRRASAPTSTASEVAPVETATPVDAGSDAGSDAADERDAAG